MLSYRYIHFLAQNNRGQEKYNEKIKHLQNTYKTTKNVFTFSSNQPVSEIFLISLINPNL